jgi:hypothetical protein
MNPERFDRLTHRLAAGGDPAAAGVAAAATRPRTTRH